MGPTGYRRLEAAIHEESTVDPLKETCSKDTTVLPKVEHEDDAVPFVDVEISNYDSPRRVLNALRDYVTLDSHGGERVSQKEFYDKKPPPLLYPMHVSQRGITFLDLHYPDSY